MKLEAGVFAGILLVIASAAAAQTGSSAAPASAAGIAGGSPAPAGNVVAPASTTGKRMPISDAELKAALQIAAAKLLTQDCAGVLATLDPVLPGTSGEDRQLVQRLRVTCLLPAGRTNEANAAYAELAAADPNDPELRVMGVALPMDEHDLATAAARLISLAREQPQALKRIETRLVRELRQGLSADRASRPTLEQLDLALALGGWQSEGDTELEGQIRANAIGVLAARGDVDQARGLLTTIDDPEMLADMAIERQFQPIWPEVEAQLGPHTALAVDAFAAERLGAFANQPTDDRTLRDAVRAFVLLNRAQDAADLAAPIAIADRMSEEQVAAVRYGAQALVSLGRRDDALARLQKFEFVDLKTTPAAISGLLEYAELLDEANKPQEALAAARSAEHRGSAILSPWGLGWLQRTEACTLGELAATEPAKAAGDALAAGAAANPAASIEGLLCLGRKDEAARIAVKTLAQPDGADLLADQFQPEGAMWLPAPSRLRDLWGPLLARSDVRVAFDKVARVLPKTLWPSPTPRPIPRDPDVPSGRHLA